MNLQDNPPDATAPADGLGTNLDGLYAPMSSVADVPVSTDAPLTEPDSSADWGDSLRCAVRDHPIAAVSTAVALGMLIARMTR